MLSLPDEVLKPYTKVSFILSPFKSYNCQNARKKKKKKEET